MAFVPVGTWGGPHDRELPVINPHQGEQLSYDYCDMALNQGIKTRLVDSIYPNGSVCYAAEPTSFVIGSDGSLYKCTVALEDERNWVGKLKPDGTMDLDMNRFALWTMLDSSGDTHCQKCFFNPACQGAACPLIRLNSGRRPCPPSKKNIEHVMRLVAKEFHR